MHVRHLLAFLTVLSATDAAATSALGWQAEVADALGLASPGDDLFSAALSDRNFPNVSLPGAAVHISYWVVTLQLYYVGITSVLLAFGVPRLRRRLRAQAAFAVRARSLIRWTMARSPFERWDER